MNQMIVMYNLSDEQSQDEFERWHRDVDIPAYAKMSSLRNPVYYRAGNLLGEDKPNK